MSNEKTFFNLDDPSLGIRRELAPGLEVAWQLDDAPGSFAGLRLRDQIALAQRQSARIARASALGVVQVAVRASSLSRETLACARAQGATLLAWGVSTRETLVHARAVGADGAVAEGEFGRIG